MTQFITFCLAILFFNSISIFAADGVCHKCEMIREENKKKVNQYEYYEDYLKAEGKQNQVQTEAKENPTPEQPK